MEPTADPSLASITVATRSSLSAAAGRLAPFAIVYALLFGVGGSGSSDDLPVTFGSIVLLAIAAVVGGALLFGFCVWALRASAVAIGITPAAGVGIGAVLAAGAWVSLLLLLAAACFLLPLLAAVPMLFLAAPIVAFEGATGRDAARIGARIARRHFGTFLVVSMLVSFGPSVLDPYTWSSDAMGLPALFVGAWQIVLYGVGFALATVAAAEAWRQARLPELVAATPPPQPTYATPTSPITAAAPHPPYVHTFPTNAPTGFVQHPYVPPT